MVVVGLEVTEAPDIVDNPVAGDQEYVVPPLAVSVVDPPAQILTGAPALMVGNGLTVTVTEDVSLHPEPLKPVTVYVVVAVGLAVTDAPDIAESPVAGDQE